MSQSRRALFSVGLAASLSMGAQGCATSSSVQRQQEDPRVRNSVDTPLVQGVVNLQELKQKKMDQALPAPTMSNAQLRQELWNIAAQQRKGDLAKVVTDYDARATKEKTLETRFLAAMAIADDNESWRALRELATDAPRYAWTHAGMAAIYARWKLKDQCEKEINQTMELSSDLLWVYTIRGDLFRRMGDHAAAERDYVVALRGDPSDADARVGLALSRRAQGQTDGLRQELEQALRDVPTHYEAAETLATLLDELDDPQQLSAWERVAELAPRNRTALLSIAKLRLSTDPAGAAAAFEKASRGGQLTKTELEALSKLYQQLGKPEDEIRALQGVTKLDPKDTAALRRIAEIHAQKNDWNSAESALETLLAIAPNDADAVIFMGKAAEKRALFRKAVDYYRRAQKIGSPAAEKELARIGHELLLPKKQITGKTYNDYYPVVMESLQKIYAKRLAEAPTLAGKIKLRIEHDGKGRLIDLEIADNTTNDPWLEAHLFYAVLDSKFPPFENKKFVMPFELTPPERK